jgi:allantoinase
MGRILVALGRHGIIKWPNNTRLAFWVAPHMEFFE